MTRFASLRVDRLWRTSLRRGLLGGSQLWRSIGVVVLAGKGLRAAVRREPETIAAERLRAGDGLVVRTSRRRR